MKKLFALIIILGFLFSVSGVFAQTSNETDCAKKIPGSKERFAGLCTCSTGTKLQDNKCQSCSDPGVCCGVQLNTNVPFIGNCIEYNGSTDKDTSGVTDTTAFPLLMGGLTKLLMSIILLICFVALLVAGVMIAASGGDEKGAGDGKKLIGKVVSAIALLGASGVILRLINPNFFK